MAGRMERDEINRRSRQRSLLWLCRRSLAVFVSVLFLSEPITPPRALGQTSPASGGSSSTLSKEKDIRPLEAGKPIERQLVRDEAHSYQVTVQANQYLHVVVEQRGIDVVVTLFAPDGKALVRSDNPNGTHGPEPVSLIAEISGSYRLEVRPFSSDSVPGRYSVKIEDLRSPIAQDRSRIAAERALVEGVQLSDQGTTSSRQQALAKYKQALPVFRAVGDRYWEALTLKAIGVVYDNIGQPQKALEYYNSSLPILREVSDRAGEATTLNTIGVVYDNIGQQQKALEYYNQALPILREVSNRAGEATTLNNIGNVYYAIGQPQKALEFYNQALPILKEVRDRAGEAATLISIGVTYDSLGENQKTLEYYNQALVISRELKDRVTEAITLNSIGGAYFNLGEQQLSLESYNQALSLYRSEGKPSSAADTLIGIGRVYLYLGETQKAFESYNQALEIQRTQKDTAGQANMLLIIGLSYTVLGDYPKALGSLNEALSIRRALGDKAGVIQVLDRLGLLYGYRGEKQKLIAAQNEALSIQRAEGGDLSEQAEILSSSPGSYSPLNETQKTLDFSNQQLLFWRQAGNRNREADTLTQISFLSNLLGEKQSSLASLNQALILYRALGNPANVASVLRDIGGIYNSLNEPQKALDFHNQALEIQRQVGARPEEALTLNYIASVYRSLGNYQLSIDTNTQALEIFRAVGDRSRESITLGDIAEVYGLAGNYQQALKYYNSVLSVDRAQGNRLNEAATLIRMIRVYESLGDYPKALNAANQVLSLSRASDIRLSEAAAIALMGRVYLAAGDYQKALDSLKQAVYLTRALGSRVGEAGILEQLGKVYDALKAPQQAIASYNSALELWRVLGDRTGEAATLYNIAGTERDRGNLNAARTQIEAAIVIVEDIRTKVVSQELRTSFFAKNQDYYEFYIDLLMQLHLQQPSKGYDALALQASERARARSLLELLTEANADIRQGVDPKLLDQERTLQQKLNALEKRRIEILSGKFTQEQVTALDKENTALLAQYREVQAQIRATSPRYAGLTQPQPLTLAEIQQQVLDDNTLLLSYSFGKERSYLWAVTKTGITSYELPKRADIEAAAKRFRDALTDPRLRTNPQQVAAAGIPLSDILLAPVTKQLGQKRLVIVSDGALQYVPFQALPVPTKAPTATPLVVAHEIITLPSASTLAVIRKEIKGRKKAAKTVAILADPVFGRNDERLTTTVASAVKPSGDISLDQQALQRSASKSNISFDRLEWTRQEAEQIIALVPANQRTQFFDFAANRTTVNRPELAQHQIVHFATHGILNSVNPELSGIVLSLVDEKGTSQNGFLRLHEIFNLNLPAELIVLSACQTGLGEEVRGEGLVGLTRGFMYAGSPRVVVSLWYVDDEATALLMTKFYSGILEKGLQPAAALRAAQIEMSQHPQFNAPYYWAAFVLQGEWK